MESDKKNKKRSAATKKPARAPDSKSALTNRSHRETEEQVVRKQYPAKPGYHGTDDEKELSPEE